MAPKIDTETIAILGTASAVMAVYISSRYGASWPVSVGVIALPISLLLVLVKERTWLTTRLSLRVKSAILKDGLEQSNILPEQLFLRHTGVAALKRDNRINLISGVKVSGNPNAMVSGELEYQRGRPSGYEYLPLFLRYRDLFVSLRRLVVPIRYVVFLSPLDSGSRRSREEVESLSKDLRKSEEDSKGHPSPFYERDQLARKISMARTFGFVKLSQFLLLEFRGNAMELEKLEQQSIMAAEKAILAVSTAFPELTVERASPSELLNALYSLFWDEPSEGPIVLPHDVTRVLNFNLPTTETFHDPHALFPSEPPVSVASHNLNLGWTECLGRRISPFTLGFEDLTKHVVILGSTGSGKSTTSKRLIEECIKAGMPVLVFDWHNEYRSFIQAHGGEVYTPGLEDNGLTISPLRPFSTNDLAEHIAMTTEIFVDNYTLTHPQAFMLREAVREVLLDPTGSHTLSELVEVIEATPPRSYYDNETKMALLRRLKPLTEGQAGRALGGKASMSIPDLLEKTITIELGHFRESEVRRIFSSFVLKMIYDYRIATGESDLRHVCIIEEAPNIVPCKESKAPPAIGEKMVSELRKFGEGLVVICQFPSQVSQGILKNSGTRICHRMGGVEEEKIVRDLIGMSEAQFANIKYLRPGQAVVYLSDATNPFMITVEPPDQPIGNAPSS